MFSVLDLLKDYWWIILLVIVGILFIIFFIKHLFACISIILIAGLSVLFFFLNQNISLGFSENMTCNSIESNYKVEDYNKVELNDYTVYIKKTNEDGNIKSIDNNIFVVQNWWFLYWTKTPYTYSGYINLGGSLINDIYYNYSSYRINDEYIVNLSIIHNLVNLGSTTNINLLTPTFYTSEDKVLEPNEKYGLYTYRVSTKPKYFTIDGIYNEKIIIKEEAKDE